MKVLVLGATGRTGAQLVAQALEAGHEVTVLARNPERLAVEVGGVGIITGSVTQGATVERAVTDQDAVLCAIGPRSAAALASSHLMRATVTALISSMERQGVSRLVLLSALGAGWSADRAPIMPRLFFRTLLRQVGRDKALSEQAMRESPLDWTIVYPPALTNGPRTGGYRHGEALELGGMPKISRADLAEFMLGQLTDSRYSRRSVIVSS